MTIDSSAVAGEFVGTAILVLLGDGVVAGVLLARSKAENAGWMTITTAWALAVFAGIFVAASLGDPDGHLNPASTIASVLMTGHPDRLWTYIPAQLLGGFTGAALVWLFYRPHWRLTDSKANKLGCFCTSPAIRSLPDNFIRRSHRHLRADYRSNVFRHQANLSRWCSSRHRTHPGGGPGLEHRTFAWWHDWLRYQSGT